MPRPHGIEDIIRDVSLRTGINPEKLGKTYDILYTMNALHSMLGGKAVVFGGTALNLFYFGDKQRLSFDVDITSKSLKYTYSKLKENYEELVESKVFYRFKTSEGIMIDLSKQSLNFEAKKLKATSVFDVTGNSLLEVWFYVYPLEVLFADKILAFAHRGAARDLYDIHTCLSLKYDKKFLLKTLWSLAKKKRTEPRIITTKSHHADTDMSKIDSLAPNLNGNAMYKEVKDFIHLLFFKD